MARSETLPRSCLQKLELYWCELTCLPNVVSNFTNLTSLSFKDDRISKIADWVSGLQGLCQAGRSGAHQQACSRPFIGWLS